MNGLDPRLLPALPTELTVSAAGIPLGQGFYRRDAGGDWYKSNTIDIAHVPAIRDGVLLHDTAYRYADGGLSLARRACSTDGGSKPTLTWALLGHPYENYLPSYVIHDDNRNQAREVHGAGKISSAEYLAAILDGDKVFLDSQLWLKRNALGKAGSRWERLKIRAKYRVVRLHSRYTVRRES